MTMFPREVAAASSGARFGPRAGGPPEASHAADNPWLPLAHVRALVRAYPRPFAMLGLLPISLALDAYAEGLGDPLALVVIGVGAAPLARDTLVALRQRRYALDYLAPAGHRRRDRPGRIP